METVLFLSHTDSQGKLPRIALEALTAARGLSTMLAGSTLKIGLVGEEIQSAADAISECSPAAMLGVSGPEFGQSRYATDAAACEALIKASGAGIIVAPASARFSRSLPGLAMRLQGRIDTHICGLEASASGIQAQRWYYRQRMKAIFARTQRPWILLIDSGTFESWQGKGGKATIEKVPCSLSDNSTRTEVQGLEAPSTGSQTINPDAALLFVAGAGWTKKQSDGQPHVKEAEQLIRGFIEKSKASLGSSKSLVDQSSEGQAVLSILTHLNQVGQTGSTPRHPRGLATCCHGEEPHVVGWRFINERRAINLDPNCG